MPLESALVAIVRQADRACVGSGVILDSTRVLTCAHVVNSALGHPRSRIERPTGTVLVRFHADSAADPLTATVDDEADAWSPPPPPRRSSSDICILRLMGTLPVAASAMPIRAFSNPIGRSFRSLGHPQGWDIDVAEGQVVTRDRDGNLVLRQQAVVREGTRLFGVRQGQAGIVREGFSGAPVEIEGKVAGIIAEAREVSDLTAYMIPASSLPASVRSVVESFSNPLSEKYPHIKRIPDFLARQYQAAEMIFDLRVRFAADFSEVLAAYKKSAVDTSHGNEEHIYSSTDLTPQGLARMLRRGSDDSLATVSNLLLHAPGGSGKSRFLGLLLAVAADEQLVPYCLDFAKPLSVETAGTDELAQDAASLLQSWFDRYEGLGSADQLLNLAEEEHADCKPLLIIDGLNQARRDWTGILERISRLADRELAGAVLIVADRMIDRGSVGGFRRAVIPPLSSAAYEAALADAGFSPVVNAAWRPILSSPLFLNIYLEIVKELPAEDGPTPETGTTRFAVLNQYFRNVCKFDARQLRVLAETAYQGYAAFRSTAMPREQFIKLLAEKTHEAGLTPGEEERLNSEIERLGILNYIGSGSSEASATVEFRHQILHDHLAALKVASSTEEQEETFLRAPAFDVISVDSASSDAIELAVEALGEPTQLLQHRSRPLQPRAFLTEVYDWNYWITLQCVMSFDRRGESPIPDAMRHSLYALNLERRFDPFLHTAARAQRLAAEVSTSADLTYISASNHSEFVAQVRHITPEAAGAGGRDEVFWRQWIDLYARTEPFRVGDLDPLWSDPLMSWTAANVLRRNGIAGEVAAEILRLYDISRATSDSASRAAGFRWRLVHALGRAPADQAASRLLAIGFDSLENHHVRYGAIRSTLELIGTMANQSLRASLLEVATSLLDKVFPAEKPSQFGNLRREIRRCCAFNEPYIRGRENWQIEWLADGLKQYATLLQRGAELAKLRGLGSEARQWQSWQNILEVARQAVAWPERREAWLQAIETDK